MVVTTLIHFGYDGVDDNDDGTDGACTVTRRFHSSG
jgi:hypothetical protein